MERCPALTSSVPVPIVAGSRRPVIIGSDVGDNGYGNGDGDGNGAELPDGFGEILGGQAIPPTHGVHITPLKFEEKFMTVVVIPADHRFVNHLRPASLTFFVRYSTIASILY